MFATKKALNSHIESSNKAIRDLKFSVYEDHYQLLLDHSRRLFSLLEKYELLLKHFGLTEHTTPETKELRTKGGPEREA